MKIITKSLQDFIPISLDEMNDVALMKRTDTKFIVNVSQLGKVLKYIKNDYRILEINKKKLMSYSTLYFDTNCNKFYHDHHNGKKNRIKVRIRKYLESNLCFLEIKEKNGKGETDKSRIQIQNFETNLSKTSKEFIHKSVLKDYKLQPSLWNNFNRITLVNTESKERVTIDLNLSFRINNTKKLYNRLVIIEVKQVRFNRNSKIIQVLKSIRQNPYSISKYCIGMVSLYNNIKYNLFKTKLIKINNITTA